MRARVRARAIEGTSKILEKITPTALGVNVSCIHFRGVIARARVVSCTYYIICSNST